MGEIAKSGKWQALKILSNLEIILEKRVINLESAANRGSAPAKMRWR
jgi:hypothetical protein